VKYFKYFFISFFIIAIDQVSKLLVHHYMQMGSIGEVMVIGDWFRLHYLLNPGMAFGMEIDWEYGKLALSLLRLVSTFGIAYWVYYLVKTKAQIILTIASTLILGGAIGNVIDSVFYGVLIEGNAIIGSPTPWFHGQVIDMLYFPLIESTFPEWLPIWGGQDFLFFRPVFNIADSAIFVGVVLILFLPKKQEDKDTDNQTNKDIENSNNDSIQEPSSDVSES